MFRDRVNEINRPTKWNIDPSPVHPLEELNDCAIVEITDDLGNLSGAILPMNYACGGVFGLGCKINSECEHGFGILIGGLIFTSSPLTVGGRESRRRPFAGFGTVTVGGLENRSAVPLCIA